MSDSPFEITVKEYCDRVIGELSQKLDIHIESIKKSLVSCRGREKDNLESLQTYYNSKIEAIEKAISVASESMEKRLDGMNEFRETLRDQAGKFITRTEHEIIRDDIKILREAKANYEGKASQNSVNISMVIAILGVLLAIVGIVLEII